MSKPPLQLLLSNLQHAPLYRSGLTAAVYTVRIVRRLTHWIYVQSVTRDMCICKYVQSTETGGLWQRTDRHSRQRLRSQTDSVQYTDCWTPVLTDRPTDRQTVSRNVADLDFTRSSNGKTGTEGRQDRGIRSVGAACYVCVGKTKEVHNIWMRYMRWRDSLIHRAVFTLIDTNRVIILCDNYLLSGCLSYYRIRLPPNHTCGRLATGSDKR